MDLRVGTAGFARSSSRESQKKTLASPGNWATLGYASSMTGQLADSRMSPPTVAVLFASVDILKHRKQIGMPIGNQSLRNPYKASIISRIFTEANNLLHILLSVVLLLPPGLPSRTIVRTVSSEQPGFFFNFPLFSPVFGAVSYSRPKLSVRQLLRACKYTIWYRIVTIGYINVNFCKNSVRATILYVKLLHL